MAPECTGNYPDLMSWKKKPTIDIYGFGMVTFQIVVNGARPYDDISDGVLEIKDADRNLVTLLSCLPSEAPTEFRTVIIKTAKFHPQDRASLGHVESILHDLLITLQPQTPALLPIHQEVQHNEADPIAAVNKRVSRFIGNDEN